MKWVSFVGLLLILTGSVNAQEASTGFDLRTTFSTGAFYSHQLQAAPRFGEPVTAGFRDMLYPTWKLSSHWTVSGAVQLSSRPYFTEQFNTQGYGVKADVLQAHLSYSRYWKNKSLVVRVGELSSAFGSFLLRYDDAANPLIDMPLSYGYYYKPVSSLGLAGAQVDLTLGKVDLRAQFANSSPINRRSIFSKAQFPNWTGGAGYTVWQGFRVGVSAYRGPYLHRQFAYFFPGEADPRGLPGTGYSLDVQFARGAWNFQGELQRFQMAYVIIPTVTQKLGYIELRRVLHPRWYVAHRSGYLRANAFPGRDAFETVVGFRPNRHQILKVGYQIQRGPAIRGSLNNVAMVQLVTSFGIVSIARD